MQDFISGPLVWISFFVFLGGSIYKIAVLIKTAKEEKVILPYMRLSFSIRSLLRWLTPFGARSMRVNPVMTVVTFAFHICLIVTPLLLAAHMEIWGIKLITLPGWVADIMTIIVILGGFYFLRRRLAVPYVQNVTAVSDYVLLACVMLPYVTGFMAYHQLFNYNAVMAVHMLSGCAMLMIIPFTRIAHMLYFVFTRAYMACEFGFVRSAKDW